MATTQQSHQDDAASDALVGGLTRTDRSTSPARGPLRGRKAIATFLVLTFGLSSLAWAPTVVSSGLVMRTLSPTARACHSGCNRHG
jgi:hypothetical protein